MRKMYFFLFFAFICVTNNSSALESSLGKSQFVTIDLQGQFGNQLFQIATAYAYALDHEIPLVIPNLFSKTKWNVGSNARKLFLNRISCEDLPKAIPVWNEPSLGYVSIPKFSSVRLIGYFQSEKYFKHRKKEIIELFSPTTDVLETIKRKYPFLNSGIRCIGVQIRDFRNEYPNGDFHPTKGRSYFERAVQFFPKDSFFVVASNHLAYAKECMQGLSQNIVYLNDDDYIEDFFALSMCQSFIISNSSYGWLAAWLSEVPDKVVIAPLLWLAPPYKDVTYSKDLIPEGWVILHE